MADSRDGTNFVDTMAQLLGVPIDNFAIGGAFTGNGNINGPGIPGFVTEWQSFLAGGGPAAFPRVNGTFGAERPARHLDRRQRRARL